MEPDLKLVIRDNMRSLLGLRPEDAGVAEVMRLGFANGSAQRLLAGATNINAKTLAKLAHGLHVKPWQLCVPNLDPERLPSLDVIAFRWPFRSIDPEVITGLVGTAAQSVENGLLVVLSTAGISPRKLQRAG